VSSFPNANSYAMSLKQKDRDREVPSDIENGETETRVLVGWDFVRSGVVVTSFIYVSLLTLGYVLCNGFGY
jgi:hypothetical protein